MAVVSRHNTLLGADDDSATLPRREVSAATRADQTCCCGDLPKWVRAGPPTKATPSARATVKATSHSLNGDQGGERVLPNRLLTVTETAAFFQVSEKTVRRMMARGELASARIGRCIRISPEVIEKIVRQNE
jgi:excisionase family DNA binding protein